MNRLCTNCIHCSDIFDCKWGRGPLKETYAKKCEYFTMGKKNFGWVLYDTKELGYCSNKYGPPCVNNVKDAYVYETREHARQAHIVDMDRILKVSLATNGRPVAVIGRG